jgi:hypothetical protein
VPPGPGAPATAVAGNPAFIIAAADTVMNRPAAEVLAEVFPDGPRSAADRVELGEGVWRQLEPSAGHVLAQVVHRRRAGNQQGVR